MPAPLRRVLHVDDNAGDRLLVSMALSVVVNGVELASVESGEDALGLLGLGATGAATPIRQFHPDLIIVDINMPGMNGFEFVDKLASHRHFDAANVLFLSTSRAISDAQRATRRDASLFAVKPLDFERLCETLRIALRGFAGEIELPSWGDGPLLADNDGILILGGEDGSRRAENAGKQLVES